MIQFACELGWVVRGLASAASELVLSSEIFMHSFECVRTSCLPHVASYTHPTHPPFHHTSSLHYRPTLSELASQADSQIVGRQADGQADRLVLVGRGR